MITLTHPLESPSANRFLKKHWSVYSKYKRQVLTWALIVFRVSRHQRAIGHRKVTLTSYRKRFLDKDNLVGGYKILVDCLVEAGYLVDDAPRWCEIEYKQEKSDTPRTVIEIEEEKPSHDWPAHIGSLLGAKP